MLPSSFSIFNFTFFGIWSETIDGNSKKGFGQLSNEGEYLKVLSLLEKRISSITSYPNLVPIKRPATVPKS